MRTASRADPPPDPFGETRRARYRTRAHLLGCAFEFTTDDSQLHGLVKEAYSGLPPHRLPGAPRCRIHLMVAPEADWTRATPPVVQPLAAHGLIGGVLGGSGAVLAAPGSHGAVVMIPPRMRRYPYHVRYELIEFAVYLLAARTQQLLSLHAACLAHRGRAALLFGDSGAGKSTLALQWLAGGLQFLAEDSVLVDPRTLRATGISAFTYVRRATLGLLQDAPLAARLARSAVIRRRSGVRKLQIDARAQRWNLAPAPLAIGVCVFLSARPARGGPLLRPLEPAELRAHLKSTQRYAARQPGWDLMVRQLARRPAFMLLRGQQPRAGVTALRGLLETLAGP